MVIIATVVRREANPPSFDCEGFFLSGSEDVLVGGILENIESIEYERHLVSCGCQAMGDGCA